MKKILIYLLCLVLLCGGALAEAASGSPLEVYGLAAPGEILGFELLDALYADGGNRVISPRSLALALGMAAEGARGDTLEEILDALGVESVQDISAQLPEGIQSANAAFTAPELELKPEYIERLNEAYGAEWFGIDDAIVEKVNAWTLEKTSGLIEQLLSEAPSPEIGMVLINALAMDAEWVSPFEAEATAEESFHAPDGDVTVSMMHQTEFFDYAEKDGVQIVRLPYLQNSLEMWIAMPEEGGMPALLETLANEGMFYLKSDAQMREVILGLPKMDISDENSLSDVLKMLGVQMPFSDAADFSGISDMPLCIDSILQKARVQVDERGTKAAAATVIMMKYASLLLPQDPAEMIVNRPFVFAVADAQTGSLCFAGVVENPAEN